MRAPAFFLELNTPHLTNGRTRISVERGPAMEQAVTCCVNN